MSITHDKCTTRYNIYTGNHPNNINNEWLVCVCVCLFVCVCVCVFMCEWLSVRLCVCVLSACTSCVCVLCVCVHVICYECIFVYFWNCVCLGVNVCVGLCNWSSLCNWFYLYLILCVFYWSIWNLYKYIDKFIFPISSMPSGQLD